MGIRTDDTFLLKLAEAEILGEAKKAKIRHSLVGPSGWQPAPKTNKSFFVNTLMHTLSSNRVLENKQGSLKKKMQYKKKERKLHQNEKSSGVRDILFQKPNNSEKMKTLSDKNRDPKHRTRKQNTEKSEKCKQRNQKTNNAR